METAFRKILIPINFTASSLAAIKMACEAADKEATLLLLHVQSYGFPLLSFDGARFLLPDEKKDYEQALVKLKELRAWILDRFPHLEVTTQIDTKHEVQEGIILGAKSADADLIVIGTSSRHRHWPFLKTSRPEKIQKKTSMPVMIARGNAADPAFSSVLVPVNDFLNEHKIKVIECLCGVRSLTVVLMKFIDDEIPDENRWDLIRLDYLQRIRLNARCSVKWQYIHLKRNAISIKQVAEKLNVDLLILENGKETKMNRLNGQIFDYLNFQSPTQVIITNPAQKS